MEETPQQQAPAPAVSGWVVPEPVVAGPAPGYAYVGFWRRAAAFFIDSFILSIPTSIAVFVAFAGTMNASMLRALGDPNNFVRDPATGRLMPDPATLAAFNASIEGMMGGLLLVWLLILALQLIYFAGFWAWRGGTPGQLLLGMQVRRERDGARLSFGRACLRFFGSLVSIWALYIGFIWVAFDARKQGWHDKIAGSVVVRRVG